MVAHFTLTEVSLKGLLPNIAKIYLTLLPLQHLSAIGSKLLKNPNPDHLQQEKKNQ